VGFMADIYGFPKKNRIRAIVFNRDRCAAIGESGRAVTRSKSRGEHECKN
jgi:hypothetical protein